MSVAVEIDLDRVFNVISPSKVDEARYIIMNNLLADMTSYVPLDKGSLRTSGHIDADKEHLVWRTPYARAQYHGGTGKAKFRRYTTPGTGPYWDKTASANHMDKWEQLLLKAMGL